MKKTAYPNHPILLVDDEPFSLASFAITLKTHGIDHAIRCQDSREVLAILGRQEVEIILLDLTMPHISGLEILQLVAEKYAGIPVIVVTGVNEVKTAVECMRLGAFDYVLKPVEVDRLLPSVKRALEVRHLRRQNSSLTRSLLADTLLHPEAFQPIVTRSCKMQAIFRYCEAIAEGQQPVLIAGETGVGKELFARALHTLSGRPGEFVAVNVAGLEDAVFSDTLFGHARGAFTGAERARPGLVETAAGGTLFLDEIGDLRDASQVKLLRFLEQREYLPLGSDMAKSSDARVLVATHVDLEAQLAAGRFRNDLYYRFRTHRLRIPPLRERLDDLPLLLDHFLAEAAREFTKAKPTYHPALLDLLQGYHFPGNIRELRAMVFDAVSGHQGKMLSAESFRAIIGLGIKGEAVVPPTAAGGRKDDWSTQPEPLPTLKEATGRLVREALRRANNNQRVAAMILGITPQALSQRLKRSGSEAPEGEK